MRPLGHNWDLMILILLVVVTALHQPLRPVAADETPCVAVATKPDPPISPPQPTAGGRVTDASTSDGIEGATVELFQCEEGVATSMGTTETDEAGNYVFEDLDAGYYYFVQAQPTGPLYGMSIASGYTNPSAAVGLSPSVLDIDFSFQ